MAHILTIQSHVVYGHAGNAAAVFPLQRLGHKVSVLNLLQFSNHTGYGSWGGKAISVDELQDVFAGLKKVGVCEDIDCIITGYLGSQEQVYAIAKFIKEVRSVNPDVIYCCDPVMGDEHTGMYVKQEVADVIKAELVQIADLITPNKYELSLLSKKEINSREAVIEANKEFIGNGTQVLVTSAAFSEGKTGMLFQTKTGECHIIEMPEYPINYTVRGTGDVAAALFMGNYFITQNYRFSLQKTANAMHQIVEYTSKHNLPELGVIECQDSIISPKEQYHVKPYEQSASH